MNSTMNVLFPKHYRALETEGLVTTDPPKMKSVLYQARINKIQRKNET